MYEQIQKFIDFGVKIASLAVTGPATWVVSSWLFRDIQAPALLFFMQFCAVFLVEGVMLSNWLLLEFDKKAPPEIKARYGLTALGMYFAMLVIAWSHEGPTGLVFRLALLAALLGSGWDTYVYTWQKATARADRNIGETWSVKRYRRKLAQRDAKESLEVEYRLRRERRMVDAEVSSEVVTAYKAERLTSVKLDHKKAMRELSQPEDKPALGPGYPYPVDQAQKRRTRQQRDSRENKLDHMVTILRANPGASLRQLGDGVGVSHETAKRYLEQLESAGRIQRGEGFNTVIEQPALPSNGNHRGDL